MGGAGAVTRGRRYQAAPAVLGEAYARSADAAGVDAAAIRRITESFVWRKYMGDDGPAGLANVFEFLCQHKDFKSKVARARVVVVVVVERSNPSSVLLVRTCAPPLPR